VSDVFRRFLHPGPKIIQLNIKELLKKGAWNMLAKALRRKENFFCFESRWTVAHDHDPEIPFVPFNGSLRRKDAKKTLFLF